MQSSTTHPLTMTLEMTIQLNKQTKKAYGVEFNYLIVSKNHIQVFSDNSEFISKINKSLFVT